MKRKPVIGDMVLIQSAEVPCDGIYMVGRVVAFCGDYMVCVEFTVKGWFRTRKVQQWHPWYEHVSSSILGVVADDKELAELNRIMKL